MSQDLGEAILTLDADGGPLDAALSSMHGTVAGRLAAIGTQFKTAFGASAATGVAVAGIAITAAVVAAGKALYDLGSEFDKAYDTIRIGTGATGQQLENLKADFRAVARTVPDDFEEVGTAIADVNTRLGLTGEPLQEVSRKILELSRITKTDLGSNIQSITRLFGDWSVNAEDMGGKMDELFRVAQATGITVGDLSTLMVQFGSPLRQLGFDFETAAAMFARFEREGVNTSALMPGFKFAIKNLSQPTAGLSTLMKQLGVDLDQGPAKALQGVMAAIKAAPSDLKANAIAFQVFGQRAGPDMAAAIREGRFELDSYKKTMVDGKDTIEDAALQTNDLGENLAILGNRIKVGLEPLASGVFDAVNKGAVVAIKALDDLSKKSTTAAQVISYAATVVGTLFSGMANTVGIALTGIGNLLASSFGFFKGIADTFIGLFTLDFAQMWNGIRGVFSASVNAVKAVVQVGFSAILGIVKSIDNATHGAISSVWSSIKSTVSGAVSSVRSSISSAWNAIKSATTSAWSAIRSAVSSAWSSVKSAVSSGVNSVVSTVNALPGKVRSALGDLSSTLYSAGQALIGGFVRGIVSKIQDAYNAVKGIAGKLRGLLPGSEPRDASSPLRGLSKAGEALVTNFAAGISSAGPKAVAATTGVMNRVVAAVAAGVERARLAAAKMSEVFDLLSQAVTLDTSPGGKDVTPEEAAAQVGTLNQLLTKQTAERDKVLGRIKDIDKAMDKMGHSKADKARREKLKQERDDLHTELLQLQGVTGKGGAIAQTLMQLAALGGIPFSQLVSQLGLPGFAMGVRNFTGGAAVVGEQGPEILDLARGTNVTPLGGTDSMDRLSDLIAELLASGTGTAIAALSASISEHTGYSLVAGRGRTAGDGRLATP